MVVGAHIIDNKPIMYNPWGRIINDELWPTSSSNSEGVAITQPRVEGRSTSTLGMNTTLLSYSVRVAISRRRYAQSVIIVIHRFSHNPQRHARMTTIATNLFVDFIIAHLPQESIVNEEGINYNHVIQHVAPCRDHPYCFVSIDTRARDL